MHDKELHATVGNLLLLVILLLLFILLSMMLLFPLLILIVVVVPTVTVIVIPTFIPRPCLYWADTPLPPESQVRSSKPLDGRCCPQGGLPPIGPSHFWGLYPTGTPSGTAPTPSPSQLTPWHQNPNVHHQVHKSLPLVPNLSQVNPLHTPTPPSDLPKIQTNPILLYIPWPSEWSLSFRFSHQNFIHFSPLSHVCHMSCPPLSPRFDLFNDTLG
jgi:hypothetical protein